MNQETESNRSHDGLTTFSNTRSATITEDELNVTGGDNIGRFMLERWLNEPLNDGPYMIFRGEEHDRRNSGLHNGSGAHGDNGVASVGEGDVSVMLGRWLDEPPNDGPT